MKSITRPQGRNKYGQKTDRKYQPKPIWQRHGQQSGKVTDGKRKADQTDKG